MTVVLVDTPAGLGLVDTDAPELSPLVLDLTSPRKLARSDDLVRALGRDKGVRTVFDATAGLGRDALALAAVGFDVVTCERSPWMQALWADALKRSGDVPRLRFLQGDAVEKLRFLVDSGDAPDAVYLDPMYPHEGPRKALQQREMRLLRAAVGDGDDVDALFAAAMAAAKKRVVVKRPKKAPTIANATPTHTWTGVSTRFDLYVLPPR
jgi:16S rRNA (guanine1516-N2)-methyltransferase